MERILVFNLNVLQKLTLAAAKKHLQVPGKWQEHFILNPQQDLRPRDFESIQSQSSLFETMQTRKGLCGDFHTSTPNTYATLIPQSFMFWLELPGFHNHWLLSLGADLV